MAVLCGRVSPCSRPDPPARDSCRNGTDGTDTSPRGITSPLWPDRSNTTGSIAELRREAPSGGISFAKSPRPLLEQQRRVADKVSSPLFAEIRRNALSEIGQECHLCALSRFGGGCVHPCRPIGRKGYRAHHQRHNVSTSARQLPGRKHNRHNEDELPSMASCCA